MTTRTDPRPVIGIVGGIGSGKSEVARLLASLGCEVCVSDDLARAVLDEPAVRAGIARAAGAQMLRADGSVDRAALARAIFADAAVRAAVERTMHPRIEALRRAQFAAAPASRRAFVIDAPLLLEVGLDRECDAVVFVDAPHELRLARVARTRGWDAAELSRRESAQIPLDEKRRRATLVVQNHGDTAALAAEVAAALDRITGESHAHAPARRGPDLTA
ncbi:MAG: dephospho-CoA kinase [Planctomycetota bacterium]